MSAADSATPLEETLNHSSWLPCAAPPAGSRLVAVISSSALTPLPLLPVVLHFIVQVYSVGMVRANDTLCATPLMTHPLTVQRINTFHSSMHLLALLLPGGWCAGGARQSSYWCWQATDPAPCCAAVTAVALICSAPTAAPGGVTWRLLVAVICRNS